MAEEPICTPLTQIDLLENDLVYPAELPKVDHDTNTPKSETQKTVAPIGTQVVLESKANITLSKSSPETQKSKFQLPNTKSVRKNTSTVNFARLNSKVNNYI